MAGLFDDLGPRPLADRLRPESLDEVVGQDHLLAADAPFRRAIEQGRLSSLIFWGPPGCGKTTLARLLADKTDLAFEQVSAIFTGVADLRQVFDRARNRRVGGQGTLLFVDEVHRFNRSQQDSFLPVVEDGTLTFVGATTENPSFELNPALLSRAQVQVLNRLDEVALEKLMQRAEKHLGRRLPLNDEARAHLFALADGDGRYLLTLAEQLDSMTHDLASDALPSDGLLDLAGLQRLVQRRAPVYDKGQDSHYNLMSALHKSLRGSDVDAALYWFARMLEGGEDPNYIARRLLRFAAEDVGLSDPQAAVQALTGWQSYERLGSPEGELALAQVVIYLATAPKSNAAYSAYRAARRLAKEAGSLAPPKHILNAPTKLMKDQGYGQGYAYDHDAKDGFSGQSYFPDDLPRRSLYQPRERGFERDIAKRLAYWARLRAERQRGS